MTRLRMILLGLVAITTLALAPSVAVADGSPGMKDGYRPFSWTGFYVGANVGLATGQTTGDFGLGGFLNTDYEMNGAVYGGQIGYNWQRGNIVLGIEGSFSGTTIQGTTTCIFVFECKREVDNIATVTGRVGYAMDRSLLYVLGGGAWAKLSSDFSIAGVTLATDSQQHSGWVAGFGFEHALSNNVTMRIEYSHIDLGSEQHFGFVDVDAKIDTIRLGANLKFN
jgi:outer membrane immunogenic protein